MSIDAEIANLLHVLQNLQKVVAANTAALSGIAGAASARKTEAKTAADKPKATDKPKEVTDDALREAFGGYLSSGDASAKEARKANIQAILGHYGADKVTTIESSKRAAALEDVKTYKDGKTPSWAATEEPAEDEDDMLG